MVGFSAPEMAVCRTETERVSPTLANYGAVERIIKRQFVQHVRTVSLALR